MSLLQLGTSKVQTEIAPSVRVKRRLIVYTNEFNIVCGPFRYLPYSTGLLRAFAEADPMVRDNYRFMPFLYEMDAVDNVLAKYTEEPNVAAFSVAMWNERLNLAVAREVKKRWPDCFIIFGGCHVPHHPKEYMTQYPFIDVCIRSEGEEAFRDVLQYYAGYGSISNISDVTYREDAEIVENLGHRAYQKDMDCYPSPYMTGLFDELLDRKEVQNGWQAIVETNRGCPF